ncbi:hypothetical protein Poli38472_006295 [Pythium oligandrum]|uniref:Non-specific serine/threonine protein kinase n=1 Tax=Pythium oligandrum TaxID=41045 RepID=A0A8K1CS31_PYTOL|nr:hypothetical protein Poli38472_006295 [Pythium oligandrum]|eukprot:TMW68827.1 hypothetical protein Poli38472_006295 [Pythium oligandrum]
MNVDAVRQTLLEGDVDAVLKELVELHRHAEALHTPQLPRLLDALFPAWKALLQTKLPPQLRATQANRARKVLLQILNRLPSNDALRPFVTQLLHVLLDVLLRDNEDNALVALKTLFDLHRNYRPALRNEVQAFLDLVQQMYKNVPTTMQKQFAETKTPSNSTKVATPVTETSTETDAQKTTAVETATTASAEPAPASTTTPTNEAEGNAAAETKSAKEDDTAAEEKKGVPDDTPASGDAAPAIAETSDASGVADLTSETSEESKAADAKTAIEATSAPTTAASPPPVVEEVLWSAMESFKTISELPLIIMLLFQCYPAYIETHVPVLVPLMMNLLSLRAPETAQRLHPARYVDFLDCQVKTLSFVTYLLRGCANLMRPFQDAICEHTVKLLTVCPKDAFVLRKDIFVAARHIISTEFRRGFYSQLEVLMDDDVLIGKGRSSYHQIRPLAYSTLADMIHHVRDVLTLAQVSRIVDFYGKRIHDPTLPISIQTTSIRLLLNLVDISAKNDDTDGWKGRNILARILLIISSKFGTTLASLPTALALSLRARSSSSTSATDRSTGDLLDGGAMDKIRQSNLLPKEVSEKTDYDKKLEQLLQPSFRLHRSPDSFVEDEPSIRDVKSLLRTMILGVRAVIWCTANYRNPNAKDLTSIDASGTVEMSPSHASTSSTSSSSLLGIHAMELASGLRSSLDASASAHAFPLTDDERKLIARVLQNGLRCFVLYTLSDNTLAEEKQMLDHFAGAFTVLDAPDFRDLFIANMDLLYECILQDHAILTIPQHFLANSNVSCWFAEILLKFLITQMKDLSVPAQGDVPDLKREQKVLEMESLRFERMRAVRQEHRASIVLRLFKIVFGSVTLFKSNESALFPHLRTIIESCLKQATYTKHPDNYLLLLRALFRSISGGKYENFYKEVFPLLPGILSALMRLQKHIQKPAMQEVLLELCLTIPARLSSLLQYLPSLMKSVVRAILSRGELAYLGLRTLEFWVDNLNPDFLYPIMTSQDRLLTEIIEALNTHLMPPPYPYGELSMRILGKIGGRNRQYLMDPLDLEFREPSRDGLVVRLQWGEDATRTDDEGDDELDDEEDDTEDLQQGSKRFGLQMDVVVQRASAILHRYLRKSTHEWEYFVKADARLVDVDELEDSGNGGNGSDAAALAASATEKDDKTVEMESETTATIKQSILRYKKHAFEVLSSIAVVAMELHRDSTTSGSADAEGEGTWRESEGDEDQGEDEPMDGDGEEAETDEDCDSDISSRVVKWENQVETRKLLLRTLFEAMDDLDFGNDASELMLTIAVRLTTGALDGCTRQKPNFASLSTLQPSTLVPGNRGLSPGRHLATSRRIEVLREAAYGMPEMRLDRASFEFQTFAGEILQAMSSAEPRVVENAIRVLRRVVETTLDHFNGDGKTAVHRGGALLNCLCSVFAHACYDKESWRLKLGGVTGLRLLVEALEPQWCHENELVIVKALFFVLSDHPSEVSATVSVETGETLLMAVKRAREVRGAKLDELGELIKREDFVSCMAFQETEIFQMFVVEFLSAKAPTRRYAKECIAAVAKFSETTESAMLFPYQQLISKQITSCNIRLLPMATRTGYIDAMAHAMSLKPSIFPLTKDLVLFLHDVWRLISDDAAVRADAQSENSSSNSTQGSSASGNGHPVSAQEYPFGLSQACELRIAAVKLFRAAFLAAPDEINQHHEARNRFVGVFFRYLTRQPQELVSCAQQALTDVIQLNKQNKEITLPKELLQQCLRPVLLNLADYRKLNLPLLDGLSRLLTLLSSCFNVTLGEKLLEHLKQWRDPERIIKAGIWKRGEEPAVAAAIIDLFHLLPPNESFLDSLIGCVVDLEAVLPKYGSYGKMSSPYRLPLTRFLNRYASSAVSFFLKREHLIETKYSSLFQEVIKLPEAAPLRAVLVGDGGSDLLVTATFVTGAKLLSSSSTSTSPDLKSSSDSSEDLKMQAQIQLNAQKAAAQAVATAQAQGLSPSAAEARGIQARAAYVAKAQAQVNAQQALKVQSQVQIQANAQKLHAQTLAAAQAQGLSLVQAQAKAQFASKDYIAKAQSQVAASTALPSPLSSASASSMNSLVSQQQAQQLHAQIQVNAQKVHAQALAAAQAQGLKPIQAQEKAKQAQATYVHRAKAQAQAKIARAQNQGIASSLTSLTGAGALGVSSPGGAGISPFTSKAQLEALELQYQGIRLVRSVSKLHPTWLATQPVLIDALRKLWRSPARVARLKAQERLPIRYHAETKLLVKILVAYCRVKPDDVQVLLDLLSAFLHRTAYDFSFLQQFYQHEVAQQYTPSNKRNILRLFLRLLREPSASEELKVHAIQLLIMPILTTSFEDPSVNNVDVMDAETVQWMLREILASKEFPPDTMQTLRIELLKLGTLLIQHMSKYVTEHRKEVIKFAWNHLKAQDLTSKLWAYVNVCRFISVYDTPPKIVLQVYVALLRTHEMDARFLVRKAFDILLPALPSRLPPNEFIKAIKWTKKIAYEEGHQLGQLVHIWFLIVRHPALFYPFRGQFVPLMVNSLNRLAIPPSSTPDNRRLAVNLVDLIIAWEQTRQDRLAVRRAGSTPTAKDSLKRHSDDGEHKSAEGGQEDETQGATSPAEKKRKVAVDGSDSKALAVSSSTGDAPTTSESTEPVTRPTYSEDDFELSGTMIDLVINFAFRFALASADKQETSRLSNTCGDLFAKALRLWPSASIRFSYFDKLIAVTAEAVIRQQQQQNAAKLAAANAAAGGAAGTPVAPPPPPTMPSFFAVPKGAPLSSLAILDAVLGILNSLIMPEVVAKSARSVPYVVQYAPRVMKLLEPCFDRPNIEIQQGVTTFLRRMVELYPPNRAPQQLLACKFYPWLKEILNERLQNAASLQQELLSSLPSTSGAGSNKPKSKPSTAVNTASNSATQTPVKTEPKSAAAASSQAAASPPTGSVKRQKVSGGAAGGTPPASTSTAAAPPASSTGTSDTLKAKLLAAHNARTLSPSLFAGEHTLRLLSSLCEVVPEFADHFAPNLLKLAQFFTREHLVHAAAASASTKATYTGAHGNLDAGSSSDASARNRVMATPSLAITDEWNQLQCGRSTLSVNNVARQLKKKDGRDDKQAPKKKHSISEVSTVNSKDSNGVAASSAAASASKSSAASKKKIALTGGTAGTNGAASAGLIMHKLAIELLIVSLELLSKCSFSSGDHRRLYTNLLVHCLESSTNIPLLLQITRIVSHSVTTTDARHMLTAKDKMTLLTKMTSFDRLNEVAAIPLSDAYYQLVLKLCDPRDVKHSYFHISASSQSHSLTTHFMMGLLAPESDIREQFLAYFGSAASSSGSRSSPVSRLQLIMRQDWQSCGTRYWPVIAVETLLLAVDQTTVPMLLDNGDSDSHEEEAEDSSVPTVNTSVAAPTKYESVTAASLLRPLRYLAHIDLDLAEELWVRLFQEIWTRLKSHEQAQVTTQLTKILSSKFNKRDLNVPVTTVPRRINVVQTLMKSAVTVAPAAPVLTPELVVHLATAYDGWSWAMRMCEFQVENATLSVESRLRWIEALSTIYKALCDDDLRVGLSLENISQPETRSALVLEALGCVHEAQEEYFKALSKAQSGRVSMEDVTLFELRLWEDRWIGCAKQLCQWQLMHDFAKSTQSQDLLLDCAWKRGDWNGAKQLLVAPSMQSITEMGCPQTRLQRLYIAILDSEKRVTIDNLTSQTAELALFRWQGLPRVLGRAHIALLHLFHQFVEVKESIQMMSDIKHASQLHTLPNLKPSINTWRERLPNKWEPILLWDDILTWRSHMFQVVKNTFSWSDAQMLACMHDSPWSVIRLAHTARKQHLPDVCLGALSKLYSIPAMDVQDAFSKLREQVSICYESSTEYTGGLSILNNTNLDYFSLRQKAEMFRLKALFLEAMGKSSEANQTFSYCLQICDSYGKGWLSWGHYCYRLFLERKDLNFASQTIACYLQAIHHRCNSARLMIARVLWLLSMDDQHGLLIQAFESHGKQLPIWIWIVWIPQLLMALGRPEAPQIRGLLRGLSAKFPQALYYTMRAFFLENRDNVMMNASDPTRGQGSAPPTPSTGAPTPSTSAPGTPTAFGTSAPPSGNVVYYRTKSGHVVAVPSSMPMAQVQQVPGLVAPPRSTPAAFGVSLSAVLSLDGWRERLTGGADSTGITKPDVGPVQYTEDLLNFLRRTHDALTFEMECVLEEMITKFRPEPEEELLTAVHSLLLKCYQLPRLSQTEMVPRMLHAALEKVSRKLFAVLPNQKNDKHAAFVHEFKTAFERDFVPETLDEHSELTLFEMMDRLKKWRNLLQRRVQRFGKRSAGKLNLEHCSRYLMELSSSSMEVPGQYISDSEPIKDLHARILYFDNDVDVLLRSGCTQRRLAMGGSDGKTYSFLVQYAMTHTTRTDERMAQMYLLLNRLLLRHKETRKRNAVFHIPKTIPLTPRVRLLEDHRDFVTLGEIYDQECRATDQDPDFPIELYRRRISEAYAASTGDSTQQEDELLSHAKAKAFDEICETQVPETLLSKYVYQISTNSDAYFQFRSEFTKHLALSSFLSYALFVGDRAPHRVLFSRRTARVVSAELRPTYASSGILEAPTSMPFRLTRNLHNFLTRPGVHGPFSIVMAATAEALMSEEDLLGNQLCLFFRDDLLSWHASKTRMVAPSAPMESPSHAQQNQAMRQRRLETQVQQRVDANVSLVMERVRGISLKKETESSRGKSVRELLDIATSVERQREMYPTWCPWL